MPPPSPPPSLCVRVTSGDVYASLLRPHQVLVAAEDAARLSIPSHSLWRLQSDNTTNPVLLQLVCDRRQAHNGGLCAGVVQLHAWVKDTLGLQDGDAATLTMAVLLRRQVRRIMLAVVTRSPLRTTTTSSLSMSSASTDLALEGAAAATYALLPESVRSGLVDLKNAITRQLGAMYRDLQAIAAGDVVPIQLMGETFVFRVIHVEQDELARDDADPLPIRVDVMGSFACDDTSTTHTEAIASRMQDLELTGEGTTLTHRLTSRGFCGYTSFIQETLFHILLNFRRPDPAFQGGDSTAAAIQSLASRGLVLYGVAGVGKSLALCVVDSELQRREIPTWRVDAMSLLMEFENSKAASAYEFLQTQLRQFLVPTSTQRRHDASAAGVVLIDELHVLFQPTNGQEASDASNGDQSGLLLMPLGSALLRCLDAMVGGDAQQLCIVGTAATGTDEIQGSGEGALPPIATRSGRFDKLLEIMVPTEAMRNEMLTFHLKQLPLEDGIAARSLAGRLAALTGGYVAKDLVRICRSAYVHAFSRSDRDDAGDDTVKTAVAWDHLVLAQRQIKPSQLQQLNVASPSTDARDPLDGPFAGYAALQKQLGDFIDWKFHPSQAMKYLGVANASGLLIHGPSGCGKSLLVKALAANAKVNFVSVKSSELLSKYFGDSERAVRQLFARARAASPCLLFFDEFDAIAHKRSFNGVDASGGGDGGGVYARILSTFLNEMDGVGGSGSRLSDRVADVLVVAATNRMNALDAALIRPGRIDKSVELGYPHREDIQAILTYYTRNMPLASDVDLAALASRPTGSRPFTGADLAAVCKEAAFRSLRQDINAQCVGWDHLTDAWDQRAT